MTDLLTLVAFSPPNLEPEWTGPLIFGAIVLVLLDAFYNP